MRTYKAEASVAEDRALTLRDLPFPVGEVVPGIVFPSVSPSHSSDPYPLRGQPVRYDRPTDPVAEDDWEALG